MEKWISDQQHFANIMAHGGMWAEEKLTLEQQDSANTMEPGGM